jgi:hypothetical protein
MRTARAILDEPDAAKPFESLGVLRYREICERRVGADERGGLVEAGTLQQAKPARSGQQNGFRR